MFMEPDLVQPLEQPAYPDNPQSQENNSLELIVPLEWNEGDYEVTENLFMDYVILDEGEITLLDEQAWRAIIREQSLKSYNIRDIYKSLENGIPFLMYLVYLDVKIYG